MTIAETIAAQAAELENQRNSATARIDSLAAEHAEAIAAKDVKIATLKTQYDTLFTYKTEMESKVSAVLQSGDPAQYETLAADFLTPAQEKERLAKIARIKELKAEAAELEATLT